MLVYYSTIEIPATQKLPDILVDETGTIHFDENKAVFRSFIGSNPKESALKLLGKVAEAEIVRGCHKNSVLNKKWLDKARKGFSISATANRFFPIGTGLHSTKREYPQKYNPSDSQRDIIWMDSNRNVANMVRSSRVSGVQAGLQVKVSTNGVKYVQPDLERHRYEVPVVYFPINNDYGRIVENLDRKARSGLIIPVQIGVDFINARAVDKNAYDLVTREYYPLLVGLYDGSISADDFVREAAGYVPMKNAILAGTLEQRASKIMLIK